MIDEKTLARFVDRDTMVYDRVYPHPPELVWVAVSTGEQLNVWMLPESRVERRLGGACAFGWGGSADAPGAASGTVTVFDPPGAVQYTFDDGSFMRFDLEPAGDGTRLRFTMYFLPMEGEETAWERGFLAGFHEMLDDMVPFLRGEFTVHDRAAHLALAPDFDDRYQELLTAYRAHVRATLPPAR